MRFTIDELGGGFDPGLLPDVLLPVLGAQPGGYKWIGTSHRCIVIHGADEAMRPAVLVALQAHVALGQDGWGDIRATKAADSNTYDPVVKSLALVMLTYHNLLRSWMRGYQDEVAAAAGLGDLQARMANLPPVPHVPRSQLEQSVKNILAPVQN